MVGVVAFPSSTYCLCFERNIQVKCRCRGGFVDCVCVEGEVFAESRAASLVTSALLRILCSPAASIFGPRAGLAPSMSCLYCTLSCLAIFTMSTTLYCAHGKIHRELARWMPQRFDEFHYNFRVRYNVLLDQTIPGMPSMNLKHEMKH